MVEISEKAKIKNMIIDAARVYGQSLSGKNFLYVYGECYFEVSFPIDHFRHLTGVNSCLYASKFYNYAKSGLLTTKQFYFDERYLKNLVLLKLPYLVRLPELTTKPVCVLKDMKTYTYSYKVCLTDFEFTLALVDKNNNHRNLFVPMSLRIEGKSIDWSLDGDIVDFIFCKDASIDKYDSLLVKDDNKKIPLSVKHLVNPKFYGDQKLITR